jgi:hypothetical protein
MPSWKLGRIVARGSSHLCGNLLYAQAFSARTQRPFTRGCYKGVTADRLAVKSRDILPHNATRLIEK